MNATYIHSSRFFFYPMFLFVFIVSTHASSADDQQAKWPDNEIGKFLQSYAQNEKWQVDAGNASHTTIEGHLVDFNDAHEVGRKFINAFGYSIPIPDSLESVSFTTHPDKDHTNGEDSFTATLTIESSSMNLTFFSVPVDREPDPSQITMWLKPDYDTIKYQLFQKGLLESLIKLVVPA